MLRQCELVCGNTHQVAWISERGARIGVVVCLKDHDDGPWEVVKVYSATTEEDALVMRDAYRDQRKASDI